MVLRDFGVKNIVWGVSDLIHSNLECVSQKNTKNKTCFLTALTGEGVDETFKLLVQRILTKIEEGVIDPECMISGIYNFSDNKRLQNGREPKDDSDDYEEKQKGVSFLCFSVFFL